MKTSTLEQKDFDALLDWLSADREEAGKKYELVREGLVRFFRFRGCRNTDELADEIINRVALKVTSFDDAKNVKTITYFYGFAVNVLREYKRGLKKEGEPLDSILLVQEIKQAFENEIDKETICLRNCVNKLLPEERALIIEYYCEEKTKKAEVRRKLAERFECEFSVLHFKVFRLRNGLRNCIIKCLKKNCKVLENFVITN